jgi:hypothetical protein
LYKSITVFLLAAMSLAAQSQTSSTSPTRDAAPATPPRVVQARRFLAQRGHPRNRSLAISDRPQLAQPAPRPATSTSPSTAVWQPLGPTGVITPDYGLVTGRISSIAIDPADPTGNRVVIGTTGGGV